MQSEVENLSGLAKKIKVTVPPEQIEEEFDKRLADIAKKVIIKGFRKGKVPKSVVKQQYGDTIRHEVIQEILSSSLQQAFEENNLNPAGIPKITLTKKINENEPLEYEASFEVYPEVKLDLEGLSVEQPNVKVSDEDVANVLGKLQKQNVKWIEVDRASEQGDLIIIDFEGFIDDVAFQGGKATEFRLELGSNSMIPGFEDSLIGVKKDEELTINPTFPENYHSKEHAGKKAQFNIKVHKVMAAELPEIDDAFAADLGVSEGTLDSLNKEIRENLERELEKRVRDKVKGQLAEKILEKNTVEVPTSLVENEIERLQKQLQKQWSMQTGQKNAPALPKEHFADKAKKNVILGLLLSQWIEANNVKVDAQKVKQRIEEIASGYHYPNEIINWYYSNKDALSEIEATVLEEQAIDKILEQVEVIKKDATFDEIMNPTEEKDEE